MKLNISIIILLACCILPQGIFAQPGKKNKKKKKNAAAVITPAQRATIDRHFVDAATQKMLGDLENAILLYEEVLKIDQQNHAAHFEKSRIYLERRSYVQAIESAKAALNGDGNNRWYYRHLEDIYTQQGNFGDAIETGELLVKKFEGGYDDYFRLAELCVRAQEYDKAIANFKQASRRPSGYVDALLNAANLEIKVDRPGDALKTAESIIDMMPSDPRAYELKVDLLNKLGRSGEAKSTIENWVKADPGNGQAKLLLAGFATGEKAIELLTNAFKNQNISLEQKIEALDSYTSQARDGGSGAGIKLVEILQEQYGDQPEINVRAGKIYLANESYTEAAKLMREALKESPANQPAWENLLFADIASKDLGQLKKDVEEALELYPNSKSLLGYYALWAIKAGDKETTDYALKKVFKMGDVSDPSVLAASQSWESPASTTVPATVTAFKARVEGAYQQTRSASATDHSQGVVLALFKEIKEQNPLMGLDPQFLTMHGHAAKKAGQDEKAQLLWQKARTYGAKDPEKAL